LARLLASLHRCSDRNVGMPTFALVRKVLRNAPLATCAMKEIASRGRDVHREDRVRSAETLSEQMRQSAAAKEGLAAFREKRRPAWQGR
jgi:enoyl-CoA hydratase/carnithine racemase